MLGGLGASGWHSCGIMMRMICDSFMLEAASMGAGSVEEVRWLHPVRPDNKLVLKATVLDTRRSRSRPEMGIVRFLFELFNEHGQKVMTMITPTLLATRNPAAAS